MREEDPSGHYRTAGAALIGLGALFAVLGLVLGLTVEGPIGFLDAWDMVAIALVILGVGAVLRSQGPTEA